MVNEGAVAKDKTSSKTVQKMAVTVVAIAKVVGGMAAEGGG